MVESLRTTTGHVTCRVGGVVADDVSCMHTGTFYTPSLILKNLIYQQQQNKIKES